MEEKIKENQQLIQKNNKSNIKLNNSNKIFSKTEMGFFDSVEQKDFELINLKNNTKNIKKETIKEFVYSNKKIPNLWKNKKNFQNIVLETFCEDNNFLRYLGSGEDKEIIHFKTKAQKRAKTLETEKNNLSNSQTNNNLEKNKLMKENFESLKNRKRNKSNTFLSSSKKYKKPKIKLRKIISQQEEIQNLFNDLKVKFPLKNKLEELYPDFNSEEKNDDKKLYKERKNRTVDKINTVENLIDKSRLHKIEKIERNIFNNLLNLKQKKLPLKYKVIFEKNTNCKKNKKLINGNLNINYKNKMMKNELNDSIIFNHLKTMNFYGPYFSYCPYCCKNNIKYYKYMERRQCLSLLNYIKLDRSKKLEIENSKFKEKIKNEKNSLIQ